MKKVYIIEREHLNHDAIPAIEKLLKEVAESMPDTNDEYINGKILVTIESL